MFKHFGKGVTLTTILIRHKQLFIKIDKKTKDFSKATNPSRKNHFVFLL